MKKEEYIVVWCSETVLNNHDAWCQERSFNSLEEAEVFARELSESGENVRYCGQALPF